jgi:hypothetical protein
MPRSNRMTQKEDLTGRRFGKWNVQGYHDKGAWWCQCQGCGDTKPVSKRNLITGKSTRCRACYQRLARRYDPNVIRLLQVEGMTNKQIAEHIGYPPRVVYRLGFDPLEIERLRGEKELSFS